MQDSTDQTSHSKHWHTALKLGLQVALIHRLLLMIWLPLVWLLFGRYLGIPIDYYNVNHPEADPILVAGPPLLENTVMNHIFGVWRRYDALHYMGTALDGYTEAAEISTVFPPGVSLLMRLFHWVIPGPIDVASAVLQTLLFALLLALIYRLCVDYYQSESLGYWSVIVTALLPLSYFFAAPFSDTLYLTATLAFFLASVHRRWLLAGIFAAAATITRQQGLILVAIAASFVLYDWWQARRIPSISELFKTALCLSPMILPLITYLVFNYYRESVRGFPPVFQIYEDFWIGGFTSPFVGIYANLQYMLVYPLTALRRAIPFGILLYPLIFANAMRDPVHRRLPLVAYTLLHSLLFISLVYWDGEIGQSIGYGWSIPRYSLALFPITIAYADWLRTRRPRTRVILITSMVSLLIFYSALFATFLGPF